MSSAAERQLMERGRQGFRVIASAEGWRMRMQDRRFTTDSAAESGSVSQPLSVNAT